MDQKFRTLLEVVSVSNECFFVRAPGRHGSTRYRVPFSLIHSDYHHLIKPNIHLFARCYLCAHKHLSPEAFEIYGDGVSNFHMEIDPQTKEWKTWHDGDPKPQLFISA